MLKPLIKYTGGKYREYEKIKQYFPKNFNNYYEPFFGGGGIFFRLHNENLLNGEKHVNDFSNSLMEFYQSVSSVTFEKELIKISDAWDFIREFGEDFLRGMSASEMYKKYGKDGKVDKHTFFYIFNGKQWSEFTGIPKRDYSAYPKGGLTP